MVFRMKLTTAESELTLDEIFADNFSQVFQGSPGIYALTHINNILFHTLKSYIRLKGDATIRTKYQIRTRDRFGPKTNSAQNFNYL